MARREPTYRVRVFVCLPFLFAARPAQYIINLAIALCLTIRICPCKIVSPQHNYVYRNCLGTQKMPSSNKIPASRIPSTQSFCFVTLSSQLSIELAARLASVLSNWLEMSSPSAQESRPEQQKQSDTEKTAKVPQNHGDSHESLTEGQGDFRVIVTAGTKDVKLAKDGKTVLIPQPSDDPDDVLNWKAGKKYRVLLSLVFASLVWKKLP